MSLNNSVRSHFLKTFITASILTGCGVSFQSAPLMKPAAPKVEDNTLTEAQMMELWQKVSTPSANHKLLEQYVGTWKAEARLWKDSSLPPEITNATSRFSMVMGGRFLQQEYQGSMMGTPFFGRGLFGYDNAQDIFVSSWIDTAGTGIMSSSGKLNPSSKKIELSGSFYCPVAKKPLASREIMSLIDKNRFVFEMYGPSQTGEEMKMMEIVYTR